jgi:hypothetical protein
MVTLDSRQLVPSLVRSMAFETIPRCGVDRYPLRLAESWDGFDTVPQHPIW